jgi:hypothetical protein
VGGTRGGATSGEVLIVIGGERERLEELFESVGRGATFTPATAYPTRTTLQIWLGRGLRMPIREAWVGIKDFI